MEIRGITTYNTNSSQQQHPAWMGTATFFGEQVYYKKALPLLKHTTKGIFAVGQDILADEDQLPGWQFQAHLQPALDLSYDVARNRMQAAGRFGNQSANLIDMLWTGSYKLAMPAVTEPVIEQIVLGEVPVELPVHLSDTNITATIVTANQDVSPRLETCLKIRTLLSPRPVLEGQWRAGRLVVAAPVPSMEELPANTSSFYEVPTVQQIDDRVQNLVVDDNLTVDTAEISDWNLSFEKPALGEPATQTHLQDYYRLWRAMKIPDIKFYRDALNAAYVAPELLVGESQEAKEDQYLIGADTSRSLSFKELVSALDRISRPTEIEDVPLPFDPDDYPVI